MKLKQILIHLTKSIDKELLPDGGLITPADKTYLAQHLRASYFNTVGIESSYCGKK